MLVWKFLAITSLGTCASQSVSCGGGGCWSLCKDGRFPERAYQESGVFTESAVVEYLSIYQ